MYEQIGHPHSHPTPAPTGQSSLLCGTGGGAELSGASGGGSAYVGLTDDWPPLAQALAAAGGWPPLAAVSLTAYWGLLPGGGGGGGGAAAGGVTGPVVLRRLDVR